MPKYTITVTDASGAIVHTEQVDTALAGSNADEAGLTDVDKALVMAGPAFCTVDCDYCRG